MMIRWSLPAPLTAALLLVAGCGEGERGPLVVSAIGGPPELVNPNLTPLDPPSAFLLEAAAQGLVHFDPLGQVEPALAQSWIVSDDGLRYTFRIARAEWASGGQVTAEQVVQRLQAATSRASRNPLKPILGAIAEIEAMTDEVLEIRLRGPRPNFLQLLAQPEMAILRNGAGTGPYRAAAADDGSVLLTPARPDELTEADEEDSGSSDVILRGERAALAVARFQAGEADLVTGGTAGDLPIARAADPPGAALRFDPTSGLFGLAFATDEGRAGDADFRRALSMAIDRAALVAALAVPDLQPRESILPPGIAELPAPAAPNWAATPFAARRQIAAQLIADGAEGERVTLRVATPEGPGYRLVFAHLRRDWRAVGVDAERVAADADADLRLVDAVAPGNLASWYIRRFDCTVSPVCSQPADQAMVAARIAPTAAERQVQLATADRLLTETTAFIPLAAPVRWSLVSQRATGFQPNPFARHFAGRLLAAAP